jgi:hypothetical protein
MGQGPTILFKVMFPGLSSDFNTFFRISRGRRGGALFLYQILLTEPLLRAITHRPSALTCGIFSSKSRCGGALYSYFSSGGGDMKSSFFFALVLAIPSLYAQTIVSSLDLPWGGGYAEEEKKNVFEAGGLYYKIRVTPEIDIGQLEAQDFDRMMFFTDYKVKIDYFEGVKKITPVKFYTELGMDDYASKYKKYENSKNTWTVVDNVLGWGGLGLMAAVFSVGLFFDLSQTDDFVRSLAASTFIAGGVAGCSSFVFKILLFQLKQPSPPRLLEVGRLAREKNLARFQ